MWGMGEMLMMFPAILLGLTWLGIVIFLVTLAVRFVKAVETIAEKYQPR
jgi:hypothetical protein